MSSEGKALARRAVFCNAKTRSAANERAAGRDYPGQVRSNLPDVPWIPKEGAPGHGKARGGQDRQGPEAEHGNPSRPPAPEGGPAELAGRPPDQPIARTGASRKMPGFPTGKGNGERVTLIPVLVGTVATGSKPGLLR